MDGREINVVIGALGYSGKYITQQLISRGKDVRALARRPNRTDLFGAQISVRQFSFDDEEGLVECLRGATTLYNTYWVRFPRGPITFDAAEENTRKLIRAAKEAGVQRLVHFSVTNASEDSTLPYFRGKGLVEKAIIQSGLSYAIIRPTVIFGREDILINNIAWLLRRFPLFVVPGSGDYKLQPVFAGDVADIAVNAGQLKENVMIDAAGPDSFTFNEVVYLLAATVRSSARVIHLSPPLALLFSRLVGRMVRDVVLTADEIRGLMANLLVSGGPATGETRLGGWLAKHADSVGTAYASELERHYRGSPRVQRSCGAFPARSTKEAPTITTSTPKA